MLFDTKLALLVAFVCLVVCVSARPEEYLPRVGGLGDEKPADKHVENILQSVEKQVKTHFPDGYLDIVPLSYRTQLVAGMNYFIKAKVIGKDSKVNHVHLRVYRSFSGSNELTSINKNVSEQSPITYFQ